MRDGTGKLTPKLHTLEDLWSKWKFGIGGWNLVQHFSSAERGGH